MIAMPSIIHSQVAMWRELIKRLTCNNDMQQYKKTNKVTYNLPNRCIKTL